MEVPSNNRRYKKLRRKGNSAKDDGRGQTQSLATTIIVCIFVIYTCAFLSTVISLPPLNPKEALSLKFSASEGGVVGLNIATKGIIRDTENENETETKNDDDEANTEIDGGSSIEVNNISRSVPTSVWPVSVTENKDDWFDIAHPGDKDIKITVPPFWSNPIHDNKLMTREQALSIGTCAQPDPTTGSFQRGDNCPTKDRTIFVAIASYRDWQCRHTLESIFKRAKYPNRIRVGVVDQIVEGDEVCNEPIESCDENPEQALCNHQNLVDNYRMDAPLSVGPVFARHIGHRLYRGEYYAMQSDAHVTFTQDWDVDIIEQQEATTDEMTVLTTYLTDIVDSIDEKTGTSLRNTRPIMCNTDYEGGIQGKHLRHMSQPERVPPSNLVMPQLEPYWAAGFSFSRGHFVVNVPYDLYQPMIFQGEEMSIGIRGFTIGYDYFAPQRSVCFHHYASQDTSHKRDKVPKFWENANKYAGIGKKSMARLLGIVKMNPEVSTSFWDHKEEDFYGLGNVRTPEKFYATFGIDVVNKKTHQNLCDFVQGKMHKTFMSKLRKDGMGIDYDQITYQH